ncbi:MAG: hypothetical protein ACE5IL_08180 [Myxococcota bacterium]
MPVGVSGLVVSDACVLFGRRSDSVTGYPGFLELLPSGSVDATFYDPETRRVDHRRQLLRELHEEVGLTDSVVSSSETLGVVRDDRDPSCDVVIRLDVSLSAKDLRDLRALRGNEEYREIWPVRIAELGEFLEGRSGETVPTSLAILWFMGWIDGGRPRS